MSTTTTYQITGMTCGHCAGAVTRELSVLPGVHDVEVDLGSGTAKVTSDAVLPIDAVRNAVDEAGYELAGVDA
ncbi:heavy-metal-associated domain-containing protein [Allorhizocola rhizosphaerae]|uniref:heavy-metal-associated domain-containing protein n=1 Tax=Allorhizocola rhizosphaerae TaxID=1872709 RepID=UPI000E3BB98D|nr:heavy metal-associated domain-containing protein [Allorhizocola rhizosphaerae]